MKIYSSKKFKRSLKKLPPELQKLALKKLQIFHQNPFEAQLKTHKLPERNIWSFSVNYKNRVLFEFIKNDQVLLINIGDHSIYRK